MQVITKDALRRQSASLMRLQVDRERTRSIQGKNRGNKVSFLFYCCMCCAYKVQTERNRVRYAPTLQHAAQKPLSEAGTDRASTESEHLGITKLLRKIKARKKRKITTTGSCMLLRFRS